MGIVARIYQRSGSDTNTQVLGREPINGIPFAARF